MEVDFCLLIDDLEKINLIVSQKYDCECEAYFVIESNKSSKTFVCNNRYVHKDSPIVTCKVEIQTDIIEISSPIIINSKMLSR